MAKHGHASRGAKSKAYMSWSAMKQRCRNSNHPRWKDWGGRGINYCERWENFDAFLSDMGEPPSGMTLDRIQNDQDYGPANCEWRSRRAQSNNRRDNQRITIGTETLTATEWARRLGIGTVTVLSRLRRGNSMEAVLHQGTFKGGALVEFEGRRQTIADWAREIGITPDSLYKRLRRGKTFPEAMRGA